MDHITWTSVKDAMPKPHAKYLVLRNGYVFTCTPCYGMHHPWWVPMQIDSNEGELVDVVNTDKWAALGPEHAE